MVLPLAGGLIIGGTVLGAYGQHKQNKSNLAAARANARLARIQADNALVIGRQEATRLESEYAAQAETARTAMAAQNVDVNTGTGAAVQQQFRDVGELQADQIKRNAELEAWGLREQANATEASAEDSRAAGNLGIVGTILSGGGLLFK